MSKSLIDHTSTQEFSQNRHSRVSEAAQVRGSFQSEKSGTQIDSINIGLASPIRIRKWAERILPNGKKVGEVVNSKTVNYKTLKPEIGGLFCEKIFGPIEDFECLCAPTKRKSKTQNKFCPDCDVEFTVARVRRYRLGYIKLASPVSHIWYLRGRPRFLNILFDRAIALKTGKKKGKIKDFKPIIYGIDGIYVPILRLIKTNKRTYPKSLLSLVKKDLGKQSRSTKQSKSLFARPTLSVNNLGSSKPEGLVSEAETTTIIKTTASYNEVSQVYSSCQPYSLKSGNLSRHPMLRMKPKSGSETKKKSLLVLRAGLLALKKARRYTKIFPRFPGHIALHSIPQHFSKGVNQAEQPAFIRYSQRGENNFLDADSSSKSKPKISFLQSIKQGREFYLYGRSLKNGSPRWGPVFYRSSDPSPSNTLLDSNNSKQAYLKVQKTFTKALDLANCSSPSHPFSKKRNKIDCNRFSSKKREKKLQILHSLNFLNFPYYTADLSKFQTQSYSCRKIATIKKISFLSGSREKNQANKIIFQKIPTKVYASLFKYNFFEKNQLLWHNLSNYNVNPNVYNTLQFFFKTRYFTQKSRNTFFKTLDKQNILFKKKFNKIMCNSGHCRYTINSLDPSYKKNLDFNSTKFNSRVNSQTSFLSKKNKNRIIHKQEKKNINSFLSDKKLFLNRKILQTESLIFFTEQKLSSLPVGQYGNQLGLGFPLLKSKFFRSQKNIVSKKNFIHRNNYIHKYFEPLFQNAKNIIDSSNKKTKKPEQFSAYKNQTNDSFENPTLILSKANKSVNQTRLFSLSSMKLPKSYRSDFISRFVGGELKPTSFFFKTISSTPAENKIPGFMVLTSSVKTLFRAKKNSIQRNRSWVNQTQKSFVQIKDHLNFSTASIGHSEEKSEIFFDSFSHRETETNQVFPTTFSTKHKTRSKPKSLYFSGSLQKKDTKIGKKDFLDFSSKFDKTIAIESFLKTAENLENENHFLKQNIKVGSNLQSQVDAYYPLSSRCVFKFIKGDENKTLEFKALWSSFTKYMTSNFVKQDTIIQSYSNRLSNRYIIQNGFEYKYIKVVLTGSEAICYWLKNLNLHVLESILKKKIKNLDDKIKRYRSRLGLYKFQQKTLKNIIQYRRKVYRIVKLVYYLKKNKLRPDWLMISILPVLPPNLRPIIQLQSNQMAVSDLNQLYKRVLYRNIRIEKYLNRSREIDSHEIRFHQRLLQEAVDSLLDNGKGGSPLACSLNGRPFKSLAEILKGKKGRFRQNLLGKRVDYSGRSVIVVGPELKLHECGLPKEMALELFQPFIIRDLINLSHTATDDKITIITAKHLIKIEHSIVWEILQKILKNHPILLNRAPTLHRLGIQAFQPKLVQGRAILLHPLVCPAFNADFDGDQMAVHVPLCFQSRAEAWKLMWSRNNLLSPATGEPIIIPSQDMILGCYYLTAINNNIARRVFSQSDLGQNSLGQKALRVFTPKDGDSQNLTKQSSLIETYHNKLRTKNNFIFLSTKKENQNGFQRNLSEFFPSRKFITRISRTYKFKKLFARNSIVKTSRDVYIPARSNIFSLQKKNSITSLFKKNVYTIDDVNSIRIGKYFYSLNDALLAFSQNKLFLHSLIWVKWENNVELENFNEKPVEIRIDCYGNIHKIYSKYFQCVNNQNTRISQFILTTVGRIILNKVLPQSSLF
jgi:DNA-directed RNA polymerase beta' subunit